MFEFKVMYGLKDSCPILLKNELAYFTDTYEVVQGDGKGGYKVLYLSNERPVFILREGEV